MKFFLIIFSLIYLISLSKCFDTDLWAFVLSTSDKFENFRHSINSLMMYNFLKKNGIPDERIILGLSEFHACTPFSFYPGELYLTENSNILASCNKDVNIDMKDADFHNFRVLDILKGRSNSLTNNFRQINLDKNSRIIIIITSHGGENFIKVRGKSVILSEDLNRALNEMYTKERYKEILFIVDTCEGGSLFDQVNIPNVYFVASSMLDQKANSYSFDTKYMAPTVDRFHFKLHEIIQKIHEEKSFKKTIHSLFLDIKSQKRFLETDVVIVNKIEREILFEEFFGNYMKKHHSNEKYDFSPKLVGDDGNKDIFMLHENFKNDQYNLEDEVHKINNYEEKFYSNSRKKEIMILNRIYDEIIKLKNILFSSIIFFTVLYFFYYIIKN